jgi:hypothetical protein
MFVVTEASLNPRRIIDPISEYEKARMGKPRSDPGKSEGLAISPWGCGRWHEVKAL